MSLKPLPHSIAHLLECLGLSPDALTALYNNGPADAAARIPDVDTDFVRVPALTLTLLVRFAKTYVSAAATLLATASPTHAADIIKLILIDDIASAAPPEIIEKAFHLFEKKTLPASQEALTLLAPYYDDPRRLFSELLIVLNFCEEHSPSLRSITTSSVNRIKEELQSKPKPDSDSGST